MSLAAHHKSSDSNNRCALMDSGVSRPFWDCDSMNSGNSKLMIDDVLPWTTTAITILSLTRLAIKHVNLCGLQVCLYSNLAIIWKRFCMSTFATVEWIVEDGSPWAECDTKWNQQLWMAPDTTLKKCWESLCIWPATICVQLLQPKTVKLFCWPLQALRATLCSVLSLERSGWQRRLQLNLPWQRCVSRQLQWSFNLP